MPFDPNRKHGYSSNAGIVRQDGKWFRASDGHEVDEDGNELAGSKSDGFVADSLVKAAKKPRAAQRPVQEEDDDFDDGASPDLSHNFTVPADNHAPEVPEDVDVHAAKLEKLKSLSVKVLQTMAKNTMAAMDAEGKDFEAPQMSGHGVVDALKEFLATYADL